MTNKRFLYLILIMTTFVTGYLFLKNAYLTTNSSPFTQEIVLIVLGTIATILITAALLNKQSEVEIDKEQRVKFFNIKSDLYFELIAFIEKIIRKREIDSRDFITLEFLSHKISIVASPEVLKEYSNFVRVIKDSSEDIKITNIESNAMSLHLAKLCGKIRNDLVSKENKTTLDIQKTITLNAKLFKKEE